VNKSTRTRRTMPARRPADTCTGCGERIMAGDVCASCSQSELFSVDAIRRATGGPRMKARRVTS
jgi:hypothetical protein